MSSLEISARDQLQEQRVMWMDLAAKEFARLTEVDDEEERKAILKRYTTCSEHADRVTRLWQSMKVTEKSDADGEEERPRRPQLSNQTVTMSKPFHYRKGVEKFFREWATLSIGHSDAAALRGLYAAVDRQEVLKQAMEGWVVEFQAGDKTKLEVVNALKELIRKEQKKREKEFYQEFEELAVKEGTFAMYSADVFMAMVARLKAKVEPLSITLDDNMVNLKLKKLCPVELVTQVSHRMALQGQMYKMAGREPPEQTFDAWVSVALDILVCINNEQI